MIYFYVKGDWHQYDDIVYLSKDGYKHINQKNVVRGREIAGTIMLDTIFDLLRNWTDINLKNFFIQLKQFFDIYGNPFVYEEDTSKKWNSLKFGEKEVRTFLHIYIYTYKKNANIVCSKEYY